MKVFFIGSVNFSKEMLTTLLEINCIDVVGIATKSNSSFNTDHCDLSPIAVDNNIPYKYVKDINASNIISWISSLEPDIIFCFGWSSLIKEQLLKLTPKGVVGYHPAALPKNRGRHPIIWALALGLEKTASTFFLMNEGADSGPILSQSNLRIEPEDDAGSLYNKLIVTAKSQLKEFSVQLDQGLLIFHEQDHEISNHWRKRGINDGLIDFRMHSKSIKNLVRALTKPYAGAHIMYNSEEIKIWSVSEGPDQEENIEPGKILELSEENEILVKTADSSIWLTNHDFKSLPKINTYL